MRFLTRVRAWKCLTLLLAAMLVAVSVVGLGCGSSQSSGLISPAVGAGVAGIARSPTRGQAHPSALGAAALSVDIEARPALNDLVPPQSLPRPGEELWVIEKVRPAAAPVDDKLPRSGALLAKLAPDDTPEKFQPCPLKHTDVKASVAGYVSSVDVTQTFHNPFGVKIEAVYVFPLPANAAVSDFLMTVGDRTIRGVIREREEARKIYEAARNQGYVASLLTQERPNIFTQSVANIEPGKQVKIDIRYYNTLAYSDGWYELNFPMVVGPRFNPPGTADGIGAVATGARGATGQPTEISYLPPGTRSGHDISLAVDLDAGVAMEETQSVNHKVSVARTDARRAKIVLDAADSLPNKDFVLRWRVAGDAVKSGLVALPGEKQGYFSMMIVPPAELKNLPQQPLEFIFTLDVSGSMSGRPIEQSRGAMRYALSRLNPNDRFNVVKFFDDAELMAPQSVPATPQNVERAMAYVSKMQAGGGTMMLEGMRKSLSTPRDPERTRIVAFLTDGYIGNETQILGAMHNWLGDARVFSFGVGSSTNRYLLDEMAKAGRGASAYVALEENPDVAMGALFERVRHPALTDLAIDFGTLGVTEAYPKKTPDLLVGRPVIITGKFAGGADLSGAKVRVSGRAGGETRTLEVPLANADAAMAKALPAVWARMKIADLAADATWKPDANLPEQVKQVALEYGLLSSFTAFVAVDASRKTEGDHGVTTHVPVPMPDGVRYDTTVSDAKPAAGGAKD